MITKIKALRITIFSALSGIMLFLGACKKDISGSSEVATTTTIAVAASQAEATTAASSTDSVYIVQPCARGSERKAIAQSDLPGSVSTYLSANYAGYTFNKAFSVVKSSGAATAFVVVIFFNDKPVGILFDSSGNFIKVLEQRERGDLDGKGWHDGGRFCDRNGLQRDTIDISKLSSSILSYLATTYPQDTLVKAFKNHHDSSIIVISKNNGLFATVFNASGVFLKRIALPSPSGNCVSISQSTLPAVTLGYLSTTYPNYIFEKAFAVYTLNVLQGYVVVINANNTKYAVRFDASGSFVAVKTIW